MPRAVSALLLGTLFSLFGCTEKKTMTLPDSGTMPVEGDPEIVDFSAASTAVARGEAVELHWQVKNARMVTIFSATEILTTTEAQEGSVMTLPLRNKAAFTIRAVGSGPAVGEVVDVEVIWPDAVITEFDADPDSTFIQGFVTLRWTTENAVKVTLKENGNVVPNGVFMGQAAASSSLMVFVQTATTVYTIEAENPTFTATDELTVLATAPPTIVSFRSTPRTFAGTSTTAVIEWRTTGFTRLELLENFVLVPEFPGTQANGTISRNITWNTDYYLTGYVGDLQYTQAVTAVAHAATEYENNDSMSTAQYITYEGGVVGSISSVNDVDYYLFDVYNPTNLRVRTKGEGPGCPTDTRIEIIETLTANDVVAADEDDGIPTGRDGACAEISPDRDEWANMPFGTYYIIVRGERGETGPYFLVVEPVP